MAEFSADPPREGERTYRVTLRCLAGDTPPHIRLRLFLKDALRQWRLRCTEVEELPADRPAPDSR